MISHKKSRNDHGPHLSYPSLRQRSFPSSGAVLDVTGGWEGEESQDAQGQQGVRHSCWFWMNAAHWYVLRLGERVTDLPIDSSYKQMDMTWQSDWHSYLTSVLCCSALHLYAHPKATCVRVCKRSQQIWLCIRCVPSNKSTQANSTEQQNMPFLYSRLRHTYLE